MLWKCRCLDAALHPRLGEGPMIALADVIRRFGADYRARHGPTLTPERAQALSAMQHCRSRMAPQLLAACSDCGEQQLIPHSCGHRLCPHCQHFESERWLERQRCLQVPAEYFLPALAHQNRLPVQPPGAGQGVSRQTARRPEGRRADLARPTAEEVGAGGIKQ